MNNFNVVVASMVLFVSVKPSFIVYQTRKLKMEK